MIWPSAYRSLSCRFDPCFKMSVMRRAFNDAFAFGWASNIKATSKVEKKFANCLPAVDWPVYDENGDLRGVKGWHVFGSETARLHFISE